MRRTMIATSCMLAAVCAGWAPAARGANPMTLKTHEITISGQQIETPILKRRLYPTESELQPGNAATILLRLSWEQTAYFSKVAPTLNEWAEKPLTDPAWKDIESVFSSQFYAEMKRAAYRHDAAWEYPIGEQPLFSISLPDAQDLRRLIGYGLAARIRYHLSRREFDAAREGILVGLANARHCAQTPFLVSQLIASSTINRMFDCCDEMIGQPGSPNLYWALATLPRPMLDLRRALELEQVGLEMSVAGLADLDRPRSTTEWRQLRDELLKWIQSSGATRPDEANRTLNPDELAKYTRVALPNLTGASPAAVAAMSDDEAFVRWFKAEHRRLAEMATALMRLPAVEALPRLHDFDHKAVQELRAAGVPGNMIDVMVWNAVHVPLVIGSLERRIDALRIVEAIRDYMASHEGKLPPNLGDITAVSLPVDPLTGQPFSWKTSGEFGWLTAEAVPGDDKVGPVKYELRAR